MTGKPRSMSFLHAALAASGGNADCYGPLLSLMEKTQDAMDSSTRPLIRLIAVSGASLLPRSLEDQIIDFLDGKTHGESLLHILYDHVLDEPIPARMRGLFGAQEDEVLGRS